MKPEKKHRRDHRAGNESGPKRIDSPISAAPSTARTWGFRLVAVFLIPAVLLGSLELLLRLAGYGYPTRFFLPARIQDRNVWVENDRFGFRFFPPGVARSPAPVVMPVRKPEGTLRIFILGESAALGDPKPAYGFGRFLEVLLRERHPNSRFEVVCTATTAINSHAILPIARECRRLEGDLWIVYMGHNELEGPFGAGTIFGPKAPGLGFIRASLALRATRLGQLLDSVSQRLPGKNSSPKNWAGLKMFLDHPVAPDDPRRRTVHDHFRRNLESIIDQGQKAGADILLSTIACNLRDFAPFRSVHSSGVAETRGHEWNEAYQAGLLLEGAGKISQALDFYSRAERIDPGFAELLYRIGRCQLAETNFTAAAASFVKARDADALPFRADSQINEIIRDVASQPDRRRVHLLDFAQLLAEDSPQQIPGDEWFYEHVHFNFEGNYRLALAMARRVEALLPASMVDPAPRPWATPTRCADLLGLTDWNRLRVQEAMLMRIADAPFTNQMNHLTRLRTYAENLVALKSRLTREAQKRARDVYRDALAASPQDLYLHQNFAEFLEMTGDLTNALAHWKEVTGLLPHHPIACFQAGRLLNRLARFDEAEQYLMRSLALRPDLVEALLEWSELLVRKGRPAEAAVRCEQALRLEPLNAKVHYYFANIKAAQNKRPEAMQSLREAIRLQPAYWEARYLLGVELAVQENVQEAQTQFAEVVKLRPDYSLAHLNLGVALAKQGRVNEAMVHFQETVRLDPQNTAARQYIETLRSLVDREH